MENNTFDSIKIGLASPEMIRSWSHGEVTKAETINYRTLKAERDGLFCERIFGPTKDWECLCGKYKRVRFKGKVCEKCGVEVTTKKVRRERMGNIELAAPVSHIWYFKALPSRMGAVLDMSTRLLERVLYFARYVVIDPGNTPLEKKQLLTDAEYKSAREKYEDDFKAGMGAEAVRELLRDIDLDKLSAELRESLQGATGPKKVKIIKRLEIVEAFRKSGNRPEWMILDTIPVLPADIRPMVQLDGGRFAASDINELYRRVINRNNRLKHFLEMRAPEIIIRNEKRMLQEFVDALIDNGKRGKAVTGASNRPLKSLSEILRGKQGRFRQNLLGKRVDYSGRSVIVVGPELKIYQCGLPKEMALELFKPFVMKRLIETQKANSIRDAKKKADKVAPEVWDALEYVIKEHPVLLNRAPTLHRLSIQAFEPILVEGRAIKLHPLVCPAFNADFDGDQMPVHVPLSSEAQAEARFLMLSANNLLKPVSGKAVTVPSQDMVLGSYYLTIDHPGELGEGKFFRDFNEVEMAYENKRLGIHAAIKVRVTKVIDGVEKSAVIDATYGRLIFNKRIPQDLGYVDRSRDPFSLEINFPTTSKKLKEIVDLTIKYHGFAEAAKVLDEIKSMGYKYSTRGSLSIAVYDMTIPSEKKQLLEAASRQVDEINELYNWGELSDDERYKQVIDIWDKTTNAVTDALIANLDKYNSLNMIATSGARGSIKQMRQLAGMRGLMFATNGKTIEIPIKSNFREGLTMLEYFMGAKGSRKSLSDTALRTADSGYLTRRLVDVSQDVIVREEDCGSTSGIVVSDIISGQVVVEKFYERLLGRYTVSDVINEETGELIAPANTMIDEEMAHAIIDAGITQVEVRTILRCLAKRGVCAHCYGADLAHGTTVSIGEAVGVIAAQSIGEPGTQLTMRTFHTGGVAGSDITQGLPRVEELFEARRPKKTAVVTEFTGTARIVSDKKLSKVIIQNPVEPTADEVVYEIPFGMRLSIEDGQEVKRGQQLTEGFLNPADVLHMSGIDAVYDYIIREVQKVYRGEDVEINDKHIECIARQMTRKIEIEDAGDTDLLVGTKVDVVEFREANEEIERRCAAGEMLRKAEGAPLLLGITKAALMTESFLSAASFQETTRVLTEAAISGKKDKLLGLKENVIIGKLIPAGTGIGKYRAVEVEDTKVEEDISESTTSFTISDDEQTVYSTEGLVLGEAESAPVETVEE
ncbi:MAG: DNA-directed RNA polymerase subunit beta' [Clostridia bacterium]|nr:DNA-directed RNA polymerase subunit beta' [Clostridia bacterium]